MDSSQLPGAEAEYSSESLESSEDELPRNTLIKMYNKLKTIPSSDEDKPKRKVKLKRMVKRTMNLGNNKGPQHHYKFPNLEYQKKISLSRKFLKLNHAFKDRSCYSTNKAKSNLPKYDWKSWYTTVHNLTKKATILRQLLHKGQKEVRNTTTPPDILVKNLAEYGIPEDKCRKVAEHELDVCFGVNHGIHANPIIRKKKNYGMHINKRKMLLFPTQYSDNQTPSTSRGIELNNSFVTEELSNPIINPVQEEDPKIAVMKTEEWQRANWTSKLQRESFKVELNEIWHNRRLYGKEVSGTGNLMIASLSPPLVEILVETLRFAFFKQDWHQVSKCIEGLAQEASAPGGIAFTRHWTMWNAGFYSILRFENSLSLASQNVKKFANDFNRMYRPLCYPRRLGVEVAIWLTQEGRFLEGVEFLEEMEESGRKSGTNKRMMNIEHFNPKRDAIDFLAQLIKAVKEYAIYKQIRYLNSTNLLQEYTEDVERSGKNALSAFENLVHLSIECEVTAYLQQLIELTIKFRSVEEAKELFDQLILKYYGNSFVEKGYLKFLSKYYTRQKTAISKQLQLKNKFKLETPSHWSHQSRAISLYRKKREKEMGEDGKVQFNKLPNPAFSW